MIAALTLAHTGIIAYALHKEQQEETFKFIGGQSFLNQNDSIFFIEILKQVYSISEAGIRNYSSGSEVKAPAKEPEDVQGSGPSDVGSQVVTDSLQSNPSRRQLKHPPEPGQD